VALALGGCGMVDAASLEAPPRGGAVHVVHNCNDDGPGSLREAAQLLAASGDRIDLAQLPCSRITLATGAISFGLDDLELVGPGAQALSIDAGEASPVFVHVGSGNVRIAGMTIENGYKYSATADAPGGCIYSQGNLVLDGTVVARCEAAAKDGWRAEGGGVFVAGDLTLIDSTLTGNRAVGIGNANSIGGGARVGGDFTMKYSLLHDNGAETAVGESTGGHGSVGGAVVYGDVLIRSSAVVRNRARRTGGLDLRGYYATQPATIINSTISGNIAHGVTRSAGIDASTELILLNSTIAGNDMWLDADSYPGSAAGLFVNLQAQIESTIIAGNTAGYDFLPPPRGTIGGSEPSDLGGHAGATISGNHDLIVASTLAVPTGTLRVDPMLDLLPCAATTTGAAAWRRLPLQGSPAIDAGSNPQALDYDQRGSPHPRRLGAATDIGAVEYDPDAIFASGFEWRCVVTP
jgi:hypothetical protein